MPARKKTTTTKKTTKSTAKSKAAVKEQPVAPAPVEPAKDPPAAESKPVDSPPKPNKPAADQLPSDAPAPRKLSDQPASAADPTVPVEQPKPLPLVKTTYNQTQVKRSALLFALVILIGLGILAWLFRDALFFWNSANQQRANQPWINLQPEAVDQQKLATIPEASRPATPAEATASADLPPAYFNQDWAAMDVDSLFAALRQAQQALEAANIDDHGTLDGVLSQAEQAQQQGNTELAKEKLLYGLQLAEELASLAEYYGSD